MRVQSSAPSLSLDAEYDPTYIVKDAPRYLQGYEEESAKVRKELTWSHQIPYGPGQHETLDIAPASEPGAPVVLFFHGGYWQSLSSREFHFVARGLHAFGFTVVVVNHALCPYVTLTEITNQCRAALAWVHGNISSFHGNASRIFAVGHSAGAQEVAMLLNPGWFDEQKLPHNILKGALVISGIFDLRPLRQCSVRQNLRLTDEIVTEQSPVLNVPIIGPPLLVSVGEKESSEFHRQSNEYLAAWKRNGLSGSLLVQPGKNHFDVIDGFADSKSLLCKAFVDFAIQCERSKDTTMTRRRTDLQSTTSASQSSRLGDATLLKGHAQPSATPPKAAPLGPPVKRVLRNQPVEVSFAQERIWFIHQLFPGTVDYNEPILIRMAEPVDVDALERALSEIVRRHEAWRTVFTAIDGTPRQKVLPARPFQLEVADVGPSEPEIMRDAVRHARMPFDLARGPLVRALLIRSSEKAASLVITAHHLVVDGVSFFNVFLPELSELYAAFVRNEPSPLTETSLHYADFSAWQRNWLSETTLAPKIAYWKEHLAGFSELALPTDFARPTTPTGQGARVPVSVSMEVVTQLRAIARKAGVTLFTTLLAVWKTLLFHYSGQNDIIVGSAAAGRPRPEFEGLIGFFNNNLILRTKLDPAMSFIDLLPKVGDVLKEAREHQDVPFDRLVKELNARRGPHETPFYNNTFILMPPIAQLEATPDWSAGRIDIGVAKVDLYLELHQRSSGLVGHIEYQTDLFAKETIERMVGHLGVLLEGIVRNPQDRLADLPLLTTAEEKQLDAWQGPRVHVSGTEDVPSLDGLFEAQAARSPLAIAVEYGDARLTYADLDARANQWANYLQSLGVGPDTLVGLCIERSIDALVAILGVLKAGGAYVPLDPTFPRERMRFMLEDTALDLLVINRKNMRGFPPWNGRTVVVEEEAAKVAAQITTKPISEAHPGSLAYIIYTSGSTGQPKGVMVERRGLYYLAKAQERQFGFGVGTRILQFFSINFDGSVGDFTLSLPVGATLVLADPEKVLGGASLVDYLQKADIHGMVVTPSALLAAPYRDLPALGTIITAGEALSPSLLHQWAPNRRFHNAYGPTEATVAAAFMECDGDMEKPPIGQPIDEACMYVLDEYNRRVPVGVPGELCIGGPGLARGYLNQPEQTAKRFIQNPFPEAAGMRLYRTGDRVKWRADGLIDYVGRVDRQVKLRGFRIELDEIEVTLAQHPAVEMVAVQIVEIAQDKRIVAYIVGRPTAPSNFAHELKTFARARLPEYMVPATISMLERMPLNSSGKIDRAALPVPSAPQAAPVPAAASLERAVHAIWKEILGSGDIDPDAAFFDIGGHSLALARVQAKLTAEFGVEIDMMTMLQLSTIRKMVAHLNAIPTLKAPRASVAKVETAAAPKPAAVQAEAIAIVGMAIRAPGVQNSDDLWEVVRTGTETIRALNPADLIAAGADPARVRQKNFVPAEGILDDADHFDAEFFGFHDADATWMDPQQRLFLECAYEALEHAGYDPARYPGQVGVFAGAGIPRYWVGPVADALRAADSDQERYRAQTLNANDFLATRVAFKLGLRGPAVVVQTACSTSLSAIHMARQNLLAGDCDMAIAGGVSLSSLGAREWGYLHVDGGIESVDGHCRPFDSEASGMVKSSGVAIVVMKRLADAIADRDKIHAVVLGSAMNNDGSDKLGFTAPSEEGVARVIERACKSARVDPATIGFVEAHGTGTRLGDPTEVRALTRAYRTTTERRNYCALGALKANLGHMDAAAGAAGLIKAALVLENATIPPVPGFRQANPLLDLKSSPFFVSTEARNWTASEVPRRAGVSALGIGGTNVHIVLEEPPAVEPTTETRPFQLICLSARTPEALSAAARRLRGHLGNFPKAPLGDIAYTLALGRASMSHRMTVVCRNPMGAVGALTTLPPTSDVVRVPSTSRPVVFLFPGHGAQYLRMGADLYHAETAFRSEIDRCFDIVRSDAHLDLRPLLFGGSENEAQLDKMHMAQPFLFAIEYALAKQLMEWGIKPTALLGHSLGEYVAACIAGVFSLRDALALVVARGTLMDTTPEGSMLTAFTDPQTIAPFLGKDVAIGTHAPDCVVLSGATPAIDEVAKRLADAGIETNTVRVSRASHSPLMYAIREEFHARVMATDLHAPNIPIVSNLTGKYMNGEQAMSADAWADHLCNSVRLTDSMDTLLELDNPIFVEVGPGNTLGSLLKTHSRFATKASEVVGTMPSVRKRTDPSQAAVLRGVGRLWELGVDIDWQGFYAHEQRRRVPLPTYPFEHKRYNLEDAPATSSAQPPAPLDARAAEIARELGAVSVDEIPGFAARMEDLCAHLVLDFFARRLGYTLDKPRTLDELLKDTGVLPKYMPMLKFLVRILEQSGKAMRTRNGQISIQSQGVGKSAELAVSMRRDEPMFLGLVLFLEHCVTHYDEALTGETEPVGVLYPDGTDRFHQECMRENAASFHQVYTALARDVVVDFVKRRQGQKTRILEVGAGHGRLTWPLAERLRDENVEYHFTDIGRSFLHVAEREAKKRKMPWMKAVRFDLNRPAEEQGLHEHYDLILGLNSVHVAMDLSAGLEHLRNMLNPNGVLVCVESTSMGIWQQLIWGLAPGYWDIVGVRGALTLPLSDWQREMVRAQFSSIETVPQDPNRQRVEDCVLMIASHSGQTATTLTNAWRDLVVPPHTSNAQVTIAMVDAPQTGSKLPLSTTPGDGPAAIAEHLWKRMLGVAQISPGANFFELGGDSLLAVHFLAEFNLRAGSKLKMAQFMVNPTIEQLASLVHPPAPMPVVAMPVSRQPVTPEETDETDCEDEAPVSLRPRALTNGFSCQSTSPATHAKANEPASAEAQLHTFFAHYLEWMCNRNGTALGGMFVQDGRCSSVGVGEDNLEGSEAIRRYYVQRMASLLELRAQATDVKINVFAGGNAATITAKLESDQLHVKDRRRVTYRNVRLSLIMEQRPEGWRVVHMHGSLPVGESIDSTG